MPDDVREQNRKSWNAATRAHNSHKADQAKFLREGGSTVFPEELSLLGELDGQRLVHLQCNAGQDSLSLAAKGAEVTGVDLSDEAVRFAQALARDSGIAAAFEQADVFEWLEATAANEERRFDVVFSSYGAIPWLADLTAWAKGIAGVLAPGGLFVLVEFHPAATMFDEQWQPKYPYSSAGKAELWQEGVGDYVAMSGDGLSPSGFVEGEKAFANPHGCWEYSWSPFDVASALLGAGLVLDELKEWPYANGCSMWNETRDLGGRRYAPPAHIPPLPCMYGIRARKP